MIIFTVKLTQYCIWVFWFYSIIIYVVVYGRNINEEYKNFSSFHFIMCLFKMSVYTELLKYVVCQYKNMKIIIMRRCEKVCTHKNIIKPKRLLRITNNSNNSWVGFKKLNLSKKEILTDLDFVKCYNKKILIFH